MQSLFKIYRNVQFITVEGFLDFTAFNDEVFTFNEKPIVALVPGQDA